MSDTGTVVEVTDENFGDSVEGAEGLSMVDFWATWCGPCKMVAPVVEELAGEYADKGLNVGKLDVDHNPHVAARFGIRSIPSILFFKGGKHVDTVIGAVPKAMLDAKIQEHI